MTRSFAARSIALILLVVATASHAEAADIKLLYPTTMAPVFKKIIPGFEQSSGHKVAAEFTNIGQLTKRVNGGELADVVIISASQVDALIKAKRIAAGSRTMVAKTTIVVIVRKRAPKPDISSLESFKQTLRAATTITFNDPATGGPVGVFATDLLERLGMTEELKAKLVLAANGVAAVNENLSKGAAELGFTQTSEIIAMPDVDMVGPLPSPIQHATEFAAGVLTSSTQTAAATELVKFITSRPIRLEFSAIGLEPLGP